MNLLDYTTQERGAKSRIARELGLPPQLVGQWALGRRPIPVERMAAIEKATGGSVTRRDMCPEGWPSIWPELVGIYKPSDASAVVSG